MLDHAKLLCELQQLSSRMFSGLSDEYAVARTCWQHIVSDSTFLYKIQALQSSLSLPTWTGKIDEKILITEPISSYRIIATDGSQIYPDRHQGTNCYLLNIGTVVLNYGIPGKKVTLNSVPYVFLGDEEEKIDYISPDYVNLRREELEFATGNLLAKQLFHHNRTQTMPLLLLFDGSLIFWHLEGKDPKLRSLFLTRYFNSLYELYEDGIVNASYISLPKNRELVNLLTVELGNNSLSNTGNYKSIKHIIDTHIVRFFLNPGERTTIFKHRSKIVDYYPEAIKPYFFYMNTGFEIARVELPEWIAKNNEAVSIISHIIYDQSNKGHGYPIALAEAHEQAVVKGSDREIFYHLITKLGMQHKHHAKISHKLLKKRSLGI